MHRPAMLALTVLAAAGLGAAGLGAALAQGLPPALSDTLWQLQRIQYADDGDTLVADPTRYTLRFDGDGRVQVRADCNRGMDGYEVDGSSLRFGAIALTRALCPPDTIDSEFARELANIVSYVFDGATLTLATEHDRSLLSFEPAAEK